MQFHTKNIDESFLSLSTNASGLSSDEVAKRHKEYGLNILPSEPDMWLMFRKENYLFIPEKPNQRQQY